jgi:hypothetical protein
MNKLFLALLLFVTLFYSCSPSNNVGINENLAPQSANTVNQLAAAQLIPADLIALVNGGSVIDPISNQPYERAAFQAFSTPYLSLVGSVETVTPRIPDETDLSYDFSITGISATKDPNVVICGIRHPGGNFTKLLFVNKQFGRLVSVNSHIDVTGVLGDIELDINGNKLYAVGSINDPSYGNKSIISVDLNTGQSTIISNLNFQALGMTFDDNGNILVMGYTGSNKYIICSYTRTGAIINKWSFTGGSIPLNTYNYGFIQNLGNGQVLFGVGETNAPQVQTTIHQISLPSNGGIASPINFNVAPKRIQDMTLNRL